MDVHPSTLPRVAIVVLTTILLVVLAPFPDLHGSTRPEPIPSAPDAIRWPAPEPVTDQIAVPMVHRSRGIPVRLPGTTPVLGLHVEQEVVDAFGLGAIEEAASRWSEIPGSTLEVRVVAVVDDGVQRNHYDGISRVFINRHGCDPPRLGGAFVRIGGVDERFGDPIGHVTEANIGLCPHLQPQQATALIVHEIGHAVGFGHLCDPDDRHGCWVDGMGEGHRCRPMYTAITSCQGWGEDDDRAVVRAYPVVPTVRGDDLAETAARTAYALVPATWEHETVIILDPEAPDALRWSTAALAGALRVPLLIAPDEPTGCARSEYARELARIASFGGEVLLVGDAAIACGPEVERWQLTGRIVRDAETLRLLADERLRSDGLVVVAADEDGSVPFGPAGALAAGRLGAPLLVAPAGLLAPGTLVALGERAPQRALVIGDRDRASVGRAAAQLRSLLGIEDVEQVLTGAPIAASVVVHDHLPIVGGRALFVDAGSDAVLVAAAYAPLWEADLVEVTSSSAVPDVRDRVGSRVREGLIVGGTDEGTAHRISRWVDGTDAR